VSRFAGRIRDVATTIRYAFGMSGPLSSGLPSIAPRTVLAGAASIAVGAALAFWCQSDDRRVAIRVACDDVAACAVASALAVDVWSEQRGPGLPLDVVLHHRDLGKLAAEGVTWTVLDEDIDATAGAEATRLATTMTVAATATPEQWYAEFRDYTAIAARLEELAAQYPERATLHTIGASFDGRPILALRIGGAASTDNRDDVPVLLNGTQHAREWIAAMTTMCVGERLLRGADDDDAIRAFVDGSETWVVPVVNPDGYQYSWGQDRYWRKNRRGSHGVDLNRNWGVAWGGSGSSPNKRSDTYRGEGPFSEPESSALRDLARREEVQLHVDFHAYGQLVLFPWNHSSRRSDDHARLAAIGDTMASAIFDEHGTRYRLIRGVELYPAAGTMTDYMYGEAEALSYTIELRPRSGTGFVLPPGEIVPTCDEGLAAVLALRAAPR
jgi:carboxypeptidase T